MMISKPHTRINGNNVVYSKICTVKEELYEITVPVKKIQEWQEGGLIQNVFPNLTPGERDFIKLGITPDEWDEVFSKDDED
tara:strand:+ start:3375 stop:3617 length:243 start_codon:yes stop_codon:yes gene_type:complete